MHREGEPRSEFEELEEEVLPIENAELALAVNCFERREKWSAGFKDDANVRACVEELVSFCRKSKDKIPGAFLLLIGAKNNDESPNPAADASEEEFLEHAKKFLNSVLVSMPAREAEGVVPLDLAEWLKALRENLNEAIVRTGRESDFREKQDRFRELRKTYEEFPKAA